MAVESWFKEWVQQQFSVGAIIEKPRSTSKVLGYTGEALVYSIGRRGNEKRVSFQDLWKAREHAAAGGGLSREWFVANFRVSKSRPCNLSIMRTVAAVSLG